MCAWALRWLPVSMVCTLGVAGCASATTTLPSSEAPPLESPSDDVPDASREPSEAPPDASTVPPTSIVQTLQENRDRLVDTLAVRKQSTRCPTWTGMTATQRSVFSTVTDLLGHRSFLTNEPSNGQPRSGSDLAMALDHVTMVYEVRDANGSNGGENNNRIWLQVDADLIAALRSFDAALPEWGPSNDLLGPHKPFDATSETATGQPRGQAHFWSDDAKSIPLNRAGVEGINDPHIVEIDIDYDFLHNSNPEASYLLHGKGVDYYAKVWSPKGTGASAELDYVPTGCP